MKRSSCQLLHSQGGTEWRNKRTYTLLTVVWQNEAWDTVGYHLFVDGNVRDLYLYNFRGRHISLELSISVPYIHQLTSCISSW